MSSEGAFLDAAGSIGRRIVADAVWCDGHCNWVGAALATAQPWRAEYRALEPNIYDGTAGVGLFLAQLVAVTGDADVHHAAVGAMRHAVTRTIDIPPDRRDGFHAGSLGVAWAAARAAALLDNEELHARARALTTVARPPGRPDRRPDVILGSAGTIVALLALADAFDDAELIEEAVAAGEQLVGRAAVTRHGWSWAIPGLRFPRHLCGLAHGTAGIGWALLELFATTGEERFRDAALGAFDYERSWLDAGSGTWPDLRLGGQRRGMRPIASATVGTWCHGEGGIALSRLRAIQVLDSEELRRDADAAVDVVRRDLAATLPYEIEDLTLCHGAAGTADVLLCAADALGGPAELAFRLGRAALGHHGAAGEEWPCGAAGGTTPALFRGLSGIAWWFLRLHDRTIPSPLTLPSCG